jgi:hypothetical protein
VPPYHGIRFDKDDRFETAGPKAVEQGPESAIQRRQACAPPVPALKNFKLMTKSHDLELQGSPIPETRDQTVSEGAKKSNHALDVMDLNPNKLGFPPRMDILEGTGSDFLPPAGVFHRITLEKRTPDPVFAPFGDTFVLGLLGAIFSSRQIL